MGRETRALWQRLTAYCCAGLLTFQPLISVAQNIAVDKSVSVSQRPTLDRSANGVDIVNIARPNDKGVSHNLFSEFNVNKDGVILNNSRTITNTQLGGHIAGNANLTDASARLILNEVTGANRSQLLGYTEIAGQAADYVLANPYGITCDGCGFINIPRVTLAAGKPELANGQLRSINVDSGSFIVQGMGLNATSVKHLDIIARSAQINAQLHAQKVAMALGKNRVDYATGRPTALDKDAEDSPEFALDVAALGGMYVNAITMAGTESGVGVRVAGDMAAATGDIVLTADGNIIVNKASAKERLAISSFNGDVTLRDNLNANIIDAIAGKTLRLTGDIVAGTSEIDLRAIDIETSAQLLTGFDSNGNYLKDGLLLAIAQNSWINSGDVLSTGAANIVVNHLENRPEATIQADKNLLLRTVTASNNNAVIAAGQELTVTASDYFDNSYGALFSGSANLTGHFGQFNNTAGLLSAGADVHVAIAEELTNAKGNISAGGGILIEGEGTLSNAGGVINSSDSSLNLQGTFNNQNGFYIREDADLVLNLGGLDNRSGYLFHSGTGIFELNITGDFDNRGGQFGSEGSLLVTADNLFNDDGILYGKDRLELAIANSIANLRGQLSSDAVMAITSRGLNNTTGEIFAAELTLQTTGSFSNRSGLLQSEHLQLQVQELINSEGEIRITGTADSEIAVAGTLDNSGGSIKSNADTTLLTAESLNNESGVIAHFGDERLSVATSATLTNQRGQIISNSSIDIEADQFDNQHGDIYTTNLQARANHINNEGGTLEASQLTLTVSGDLSNRAASDGTEGKILATGTQDNSLSLSVTGELDNTGGLIQSTAMNNSLSLAALNNADGRIQHLGTGRFELLTDLFNNAGGKLYGNGILALTTMQLDNQVGLISSLNELVINATGFVNNQSGRIETAAGFGLTADNIDNTQGVVLSSGSADMNIQAAALVNTAGLIQTNADNLAIQADSITNNQGKILHAGAVLSQLTAADISNQSGEIISNAELRISDAAVRNQQGRIAAENIVIEGESLNNLDGVIDGDTVNISLAGDLLNDGNAYLAAQGSTANGLVISLQGLLRNAGTLGTNASSAQISAQNISNTGRLVHGGTGVLRLDVLQALNNENRIETNGSLMLRAENIDNSNLIAAANLLDITTFGMLNNHGGTLDSLGYVQIDAADLDNRDGLLLASGIADSNITVSNVLNNTDGLVQTNAAILTVVAETVMNSSGKLLHAGSETLQIEAAELINSHGQIASNQALVMAVADLDNQSGNLSATSIDISGNQLDNSAGTVDSDQLKVNLTGDLVNNNGGELIALGSTENALTLTIAGLLNNGGYIGTNAQTAAINAGDFVNQGQVLHAGFGVLRLDVQQAWTNTGVLESNGDLVAEAAALTNSNLIATSGTMNLTAGTLINSSTLDSGSTINITAETFDNQTGTVTAAGTGNSQITVADTLRNTGGVIQANADSLIISTDELDNSGGNILHAGAGVLALTATALDNASGSVVSNNQLALSVQQISNHAGTISAATLEIAGTNLDNRDGSVDADRLDIRLTGNLDNISDTATAGISALDTAPDSMVIRVDGTLNNSGNIQTNADSTTITVGEINNTGRILHAGFGVLRLDVQSEFNNQYRIDSNGTQQLNAAEVFNSGLIAAGGDLQIDVLQTLINSGDLDAAGAFSISGGALQNTGYITAAGTADSAINLAGTLDNNGGVVQTNAANFSIAAEQLNNDNAAAIMHAGTGELTVTADELNNHASVTSNAKLSINADRIDNREAQLTAQNIRINADILDNSGGTIDADRLRMDISGDLINNVGTGNNLAGLITALGTSADDLWLSVTGNLHNAGVIQTRAQSAYVSAGQLNNSNAIYHAGKGVLRVEVLEALANTGTLESSGQLNVAADQVTNAQGIIAAVGAVNLDVQDALNNDQGTLDAGGDINLQAGSFSNADGYLVSAGRGDITWTVVNSLNNNGGVIETNARDFILTVAALSNHAGRITHAGSGSLGITASEEVDNENGLLESVSDIALAAPAISNHQGQIYADNISITGGDLNNTDGIIEADKLTLTLAQINNHQSVGSDWGILSALSNVVDSLLIDASGAVNNSGIIQTRAQTATITAQSINNTSSIIHAGTGVLRLETRGALTNDAGLITSSGALELQVNSLANSNAAKVNAQTGLTLDAQSGITNNASEIGATQAIDVKVAAGNIINSNEAKILSTNGNSNVHASGTLNNQTGSIVVGGNSRVTAGTLIDNRAGLIGHTGDGELTVSAASINNSGGNLLAEDRLSIENFTQLLNNLFNGEAGYIGAEHVALTGTTINNSSGKILASGANSLEVDVSTLNNNSGTMFSEGDVTVSTGSLSNTGGSIQSQKTLTLNLPSFTLNGGLLNAAGALVINTQGDLINGVGNQLITQGGLTINTTGSITNRGTLSTLSDLGLSGVNLTNENNAVISAGNLLNLSFSGLINNAGQIFADQDVILGAQTLNNNGAVAAGRNLTTTISGNLNNRSLLFAQNNLNLYATGQVNNYTQANIFALNNITIARNAGLARNTGLLNTSGTIESLNGNISIYTNQLINQRADYTVDNNGKMLTDSGMASILAGGNMVLNANTIHNSISLIAADGNLHMEGGSLVNEAYKFGYDSREEYYLSLGGEGVYCYDNGYCNVRRYQGGLQAGMLHGVIEIVGILPLNDNVYVLDVKAFDGTRVFQAEDRLIYSNPVTDATYQTVFESYIKGVDEGNTCGAFTSCSWKEDPVLLPDSNDWGPLPPYNNVPDTIFLGFFFPDQIWLDSFTTVASTIQAGGNLTGNFSGTLQNVDVHRTLDGKVSPTRTPFVLADHSHVNNAVEISEQAFTETAKGLELSAVSQELVNLDNDVTAEASAQQFGNVSNLDINSSATDKTIDRALDAVEQVSSNNNAAQLDGRRVSVDAVTSEAGTASLNGSTVSIENASSNNAPVVLGSGGAGDLPVAVIDNTGAAPVTTQNPAVDPLDPAAQPVLNPITPPVNNGSGATVPEVISYNPAQNLQLPINNGMFVVNTTPQSQYLVETNPILTNYLNFIGTDYLLSRLGFDPADLQRRLGDAFYETRLLRDGLFNLFGQRYLTDQNTGLAFTSDEAQFKYLMDNAIAANEALELSIGIALSAEQVAQLTHDIVWLVEQEVNGEKVLAPVYYASAARAGDLDNKGALMSGQSVQLSADRGITNTGRLIGQHDLTLRTQEVLQNTGTISAENFVVLEAGSITNTRDKLGNSGTIASGRNGSVQLISRGDINNDSRIAGGDLLLKSETGSLVNSGSLSADRDLVAIAQRDIINTVVTDKTGERVGSIESGRNLSLITREGDISNRTAITTETEGRTTRVTVGTAPRISAGGDMTLDSGRDLLLTASNLRSGNDMSLNAARDIRVENAANEIHFVGQDYNGKTNQSSRVEHVGSSLTAGGDMTMNAGRDLTLLGTTVAAGGSIDLAATRDINLEAVADSTHSETHRKRYDSINSTVTHVQTTLTAGGDASLKAGQDINMIGSTLTVQGDASLHAERDTNLVAVNDSEYHYEYEKKKKSFGRSKTSLDETLHTTNVGSAVIAGGNVTVNAALNKEDGSIALQDSRNVLLHGSTLQGGGDVIVGAGENILITANTEEHLEVHEKKKSGFGGLTGKGRSDTQAQTVQIGSLIDAGNDAVLLSGNNLTVAGSTVAADNSVELHAGLTNDTGNLNIVALQEDSFSESKTHKKSFGIDISSDFVSFSKEHDSSRDGTASTNAASVILAGNNITGNAAQDVNVVGSVLDAGNNLSLDGGRNVIITAGKNAESAGSEHKNRRDGIGLDGDDNGISVFAGNETRSNREQLNQNTVAGSVLNAGNNVTVNAGNDLLVSGSDVNAGRNLNLTAVNNATINASEEQLGSETKSSFTRDGLTVTANHNIGQAIDAISNIGKGDNAISNASEVMRAMDAMNNVAPSGSAFLGQTTTSDKQHTQQTQARGSNLSAQGDVIVHAGNTTNINATNVNAGRDIRITGTDVLIDDAQNTRTTNTMHDSQQVGVTLQATQGNASLTAGFSKAESDLEQVAVTTTGSTFTAERDINIHATNDLSITGSDLTANRNIHLQGDNDVTIQAGQGYTTSQLDEEHMSAGAGINFGSNGIGFTAYVGAGENDLDREYVNHRNSHVTAGDTLTVVSGNDTTISGANLQAKHLDIEVGNNLHAESLQDTGSVDGKRWDASGSITVGAGVSGGASVGYGETDGSRAWVTEQTSLIGTESVNIKVGNHTQVDGALIANIKDDGTDGGNLNLDTRTLGFSDLQDHDKEESNYLSIGFSTGGNPGANANTGAGQDDEGSSWKVEGSHYELDREQTTRATIGQGNVTVRDDEQTGSDSTTGLNRDTQLAQEVTKDKERDIDLYVSSTAIDSAKGLAASGDENTLNQWKDNVTSVVDPDAWKAIAHNAQQTASTDALSQSIKSLQYTVQSLGTNLDQSLEQTLGNTGERMVNTLMRNGISEEEANQFLRDNPQLVAVGASLEIVRDAIVDPLTFTATQMDELIAANARNKADQAYYNETHTDVKVIGTARPSTPAETAVIALGDGQLYINQLRETNPTTARLAEIAISGALGGGVKSLIMIPVSQGLDAVVNEVAGEHIQNATDYVTNHVGKVITRDDESYDEFAELAAGGTYEDRQGRIKAGSEFILSTVLGVISTGKGGDSGTAVGVNGNNNSGHTSNVTAGNNSNNSTNTTANPPSNNVVNVNAGSKNNWDKKINGELDPSTKYQLNNGHAYTTDGQGRVAQVEATLDLNKMDRNSYQQCVVGKCGNPGDEGGHLIASSLGGAGDKINIVPQSQLLNRGDWKAMENTLRREMEAGKTVTVKIDVSYPPAGGVRPSTFTVIANVDGKIIPYRFNQ